MSHVPTAGAPAALPARVVLLFGRQSCWSGPASAVGASAGWRQDLAGNLWSSPQGQLLWHRLLKRDLVLGQVLDGGLHLLGDLRRIRCTGAEHDLATALVFDAMAEGALPIRPLGELLHDGVCTSEAPCEIAGGAVGPAISLAG